MQLFQILQSVASIYLMLLVLRFITSWLRGPSQVGAADLLRRVTDPYLRFFASVVPSRAAGGLDMSALVAFAVLMLAREIFQFGAAGFDLTLRLMGWLAALVVMQIVRWIATIFLLATLAQWWMVRFVGRSDSPLARVTEAISRPSLNLAQRYFRLGPGKDEDVYLLMAALASGVVTVAVWVLYGIVASVGPGQVPS